MTKKDDFTPLKAIIYYIPWTGFFWGVFLPVNLIYLFKYFNKPILGVYTALLCCALFFFIYYGITKKINVFPIVTFSMTSIAFISFFLRHHKYLYYAVLGSGDYMLGTIFLITILTPKPFILYFVDEDNLKKIPDIIRDSKYYLRAWKIVTAVWGLMYIKVSLVLTYLRFIHSKDFDYISFVTGWPMVLILLIFSVLFPHYYWSANIKNMEKKDLN
ncbi:MAG: hypothetical protein ABIH00_00685 [Armatimonadota bacterium]